MLLQMLCESIILRFTGKGFNYPAIVDKIGIGITGGGRRIRTSESLTTLTLFESARFNHSRIPPILYEI